jgi:xylan 1,4-beta-xylosidase
MTMDRKRKRCSVVRGVALVAALACAGSVMQAQSPETVPEQVMVNTHAAGTPLPHFWEQMFGSGRAVLALRDDWRKDLATVHQATGFRYVRFHGIFDHEVGVYDEDKDGKPVYNWSYVDEIYDNMLAEGVRPYVELSFMPEQMASQKVHQAFWYQPNPSPPASYAKWDAMITAFAQHLVARYGIDEVSQWYFEVWNEPNLDFWVGKPAQQTYFELYDNTAKALKAVNMRLRVGGPTTAQAAWIPAMIEHASKNDIPLDFVSTHVYGNDGAPDGGSGSGCGASADFAFVDAAYSADLERVQRDIYERAADYRLDLHGTVDGRYDPAVRRRGAVDELLELLGCV